MARNKVLFQRGLSDVKFDFTVPREVQGGAVLLALARRFRLSRLWRVRALRVEEGTSFGSATPAARRGR